MTKYNPSFKQQMSAFYLQNGKNRLLTRRHFQLAETTLEHWINQYHCYGFNGLAVLGKNRTYSPEFKLSVVQAVKNGQFSTVKAALHFGISNTGIYGYSPIMLMLQKIWAINHKKAQAIMQKLGLKGKCKRENIVRIKGKRAKLRIICWSEISNRPSQMRSG